jgi:hypothetical protein
MEATPGFEPGVKALQASALPLGHVAIKTGQLGMAWPALVSNGADNGVRTRDPHLGKVVLYQLSHVRLTSQYHTQFATPAQEQADDFKILLIIVKLSTG